MQSQMPPYVKQEHIKQKYSYQLFQNDLGKIRLPKIALIKATFKIISKKNFRVT